MSDAFDPNLPGQRWRDGHDRYRPAGELIDPGRHAAVVLDEAAAKAFCVRHHYSRSYPAARFRVGLLRKTPFRAEVLAGVAVFSVPMTQAAAPLYAGLPPERVVELGRFVLLDEVEGNGETFFLARALRLLAAALPEAAAVLSYSDGTPRVAAGRTLKPGHVGAVYQAANFRYLGRARARLLLLARADGTVVSERALSKIRGAERGREHALRRLLALGAPPPRDGESPAAWLDRARASPAFVRIRHPGTHVYLTATARGRVGRALLADARPALPYPKRPDPPCILER